MKREHLILHLEAYECSFIRTLKSGYAAYRNKQGKKQGVPPCVEGTDELEDATVYLICRNLQLPIPNVVADKGLFEVGDDNMPLEGPLLNLRKGPIS